MALTQIQAQHHGEFGLYLCEADVQFQLGRTATGALTLMPPPIYGESSLGFTYQKATNNTLTLSFRSASCGATAPPAGAHPVALTAH